ncbi:META domain-containing protein [Herbaspirillum rhizosphaerae]|uniref:META domain-containing protein n=1 Tax=Herbaspirillum rhizosphaerae TaxID=346179 RepID=UPI00067A9D92|nr:META domain-containing protein [Herbaspirillum rhizosphaerae]
MKRSLAIIAVTLASLTLAACATSSATTGAGLTASQWELTSWPGHEIPHGDNGEPVILSFQDNGKEASVSGRAWCNRFNAPYVLREGSRLTIGHAAATRMACMGKAMEFESAFLDKLQALDRYKIDGKTLQLFAVDGEVMTLQARDKEAGAAAVGNK